MSAADEAREKELHELIVAQLTGEMSDEQHARLEQLLADDARLRRLYVEYIYDAGVLHHVLYPTDATDTSAWPTTNIPPDAAAAGDKVTLRHVYDKLRRMKRTSLAVATLVLGVLLTVMYIAGPPYYRRWMNGNAPEIVAHLTGADKSRWAGEVEIPLETPLTIGQRLILERGLAEVTYANGAVVTLNGPCAFSLTGESSGVLERGALSAWIGQEARGFAVKTPSASIVDLGTEFTVEVDGDATTLVRVYQGKVQLSAARQTTMQELTAGMSVRTRSNGTVQVLSDLPASTVVRQLPRFNGSTTGEFVAYKVANGAPGRQNFDGALGMDFVVQRPIEVTRLGVYDNGGDGFARTITAELWQRDVAGTPDDFGDDRGGELLATLQFTPEQTGRLAGSQRFGLLADPLVLPPGDYTIVAHGYGPGELASNEGPDPPSRVFKSRSSGRDAIRFAGVSRYGVAGQFPTTADVNSNPQQYAAGTFAFRIYSDISPNPSVNSERD